MLRDIPALAASAGLIALLVVTLIVSLVTIVFGELVPKTHRARPRRAAGASSSRAPVELLGRVLAPLVWLLTTLTNAITRLFGVTRRSRRSASRPRS